MWFAEFKDGYHGGHLGYWNRSILALLIPHNIPMPPIKFKLNPTYRSRAYAICRFSRWLPWLPSLLSEQNHFSQFLISMLPWCIQVSAPSDIIQEQKTIEDLQDCRRGSNHGYRNKMTLAILNLPCRPNASHQVLTQSDLKAPYSSKIDILLYKEGLINWCMVLIQS